MAQGMVLPARVGEAPDNVLAVIGAIVGVGRTDSMLTTVEDFLHVKTVDRIPRDWVELVGQDRLLKLVTEVDGLQTLESKLSVPDGIGLLIALDSKLSHRKVELPSNSSLQLNLVGLESLH